MAESSQQWRKLVKSYAGMFLRSETLTTPSLVYETLPVVDWATWPHSGGKQAGMLPVMVAADGSTSPLNPEGMPTVKALNSTDLSIVQPLKGGGTLSIICAEKRMTFKGMDGEGRPLKWALQLVGGDRLKATVKEVSPTSVVYSHSGMTYRLKLGAGARASRQTEDGSIWLVPTKGGKIILTFDTSGAVAGS